jgi:hypothetical protein
MPVHIRPADVSRTIACPSLLFLCLPFYFFFFSSLLICDMLAISPNGKVSERVMPQLSETSRVSALRQLRPSARITRLNTDTNFL